MSDPPEAWLSHRCPGRARLKIGDHRGDEAYLAALSRRLAAAPGVTSVTANALTASLLIRHEGALDDILSYAADQDLVRLSDRPVYARSEFSEPDEISLKGLATLAIFGLGVFQLVRGNVLGPATGLFTLAWHLYRGGDDDDADEAA